MQGFKPNQMLFKHDCVSVIVMHKFCTLCVCDLCRETVSPKATLMGYSVWLFRPFTKPRIAEFEASILYSSKDKAQKSEKREKCYDDSIH